MMRLVCLVFLMLFPACAGAHELRPAYLAMEEIEPDVFRILWKVPALGEQRLDLRAFLPGTCSDRGEPVHSVESGAAITRWQARCPSGLNGGTIGVAGLEATMTDVLVRIAYLDGGIEVARLTPEMPSMVIKGPQSVWAVAQTYLVLGVEHILMGIDHLVFVFALILLIRDRWSLVKTITAFTLAHSITLAGATLGLFSLPQKPVEAVIALSIVFLAVELAKSNPAALRGSERFPWLVAFVFGLLHGFGFAGALHETGLPQNDIGVALLTFNLGVEVGQLAFVAAVLMMFRALSAIPKMPLAALRQVSIYGIGTVSMLWLVMRLASFAVT